MERFLNLHKDQNSSGIKNILLQFALILSICMLVSFPITTFWRDYSLILHTAIELVCIFIALSSFFIIFHISHHKKEVNLLMGLGFLMIGVFDLFHTIYYHGFNWYPISDYDLTTTLWIMGRLTEGLLLFAVVSNVKPRINRYAGTVLVCCVGLGISYILIQSPTLIPPLNIEGIGLTPLKIYLEYFIILLFSISLFRLKKDLHKRGVVTTQYLFMALLLAVSAELNFTLYKSIYDYNIVLGHVLRVCSYYYIFKGVFVSTITYPYELLESSSNYMSRVLDHLPLAIVTYNKDQKVTFANERALQILNCDENDIAGSSQQEIFTRFKVRAWDTKLPNSSEPKRRDGEKRLCYLTSMRGKEYILSYTTYDLSEYGYMYVFEDAKKEQQLENLEIQTRTLLNSIDNIVVICNNNLDIIMFNELARKSIGFDEHSIISHNLKEIGEKLQYSPLNSNDIFDIYKPTPHSFKITIHSICGNRKLLSVKSSPIFNVEKEKIGIMFVASDITEREQIRERMIQQEKLAVLGQMAAGIVHEIKNPLTSIKGFNQIIMAKTSEDLTREYAQIIEEEVEAVDLVVSDFLAFAKPRKPILKETTLSSLVKSIETMIETQLFVKGIGFQLCLSSDEHHVLIDEAQLKQVILNMVKNSIDALDSIPNPMLTIALSMIEQTGEMKISIQDNGQGILPHEKSHIGTPFFTTKEKGTGLGLSICYQIIKENNGSIICESEPLKGTTFHIIIPCTPECRIPSYDIA